MTEESAVKVCVRVRPLIEREESAATENAEPVQLYWKAEKKSIQQIDDGNPTKTFSFDRVFSSEETTHQLYQDIAKPLVVSTVEGYNGTIFAYGQTSSGKTFTMMGSDLVPGVIPLAMEDVFQTIKNFPKKEFLLRVSYMEIYNETVTDLLVDSWKRKPLEVRETINKNVYVADLTEELVTSPAQALAWIRKGEKNRHYGKTKMNQRSSRSHTIFRMILESRERSDPASGENADGAIIVSHLNLVDLAGSERASQTGAEGARFKEGCNINRSLFTLGQVIKKLSDESQRGFTNYRDSKLTRILQNSLGGNAKTVIICTITPAALDETVSTLQFASTAKNMKNDPHVTEVSDDGALLKRYRNEIVDLKRRLQEVSSITHTTATEKKVLSQLLQEKDQLQREQEDRIRNLTKLLVTSSNFVPVPKMPKRRVTWGGKLLRMAQASESDMGLSDLSFAESVTRKRKAERSCLTELAEDDEDFDSRWEIPEEPSYDAEMNQSSVTVHSFGDSPKDFISPNRIHELSDKVSNLEVQLELETNQKDQAVMKAQTLDAKVAELEEQLKTEAQQKQEAQEKIETVEQRLGELDLKLQSEAQEKQDATEWVEMLELKVADLERQLAQQSQVPSETEQMRKEFAETIQLCETLVSEKEMVTAERDYLKQELGLFMEQTVTLEKENTALSKELEEKKEMDEFRYLEETCRNEHENELKNEISSLKNAVESSELKCQELEAKLQAMSEELKKKAEWAAELQSMNDKDLVQQVTQLRRSLDDAEGLSRDTKKEWAVLRSQNIALKERDEALTASYEKMEAEVTGLRSELEAEKSRYKKMQMDLQKELNVAFDENTKLTTLLDGKVPKNLIDSVELERTVANLNKELAASRDTEGALQAQLEEMASLRDLPDKVKNLMKQVSELTEELCSVQTQRDSLLSAQAQSQEEVEQLRDSLQTSQDEIIRIQGDLGTAELREQDLSQRFAAATEQLERFRSELEHSEAEKSQLLATVEETHLRLDEGDQQRASLEEKLNEVQQLMKDLEEKLADSELSRTTEEEIGKELQEQLNQATEELQRLQTEKDAFLSEKTSAVQSSAEEMENLLSKVASLTEERDQLKMDLQENVKMLNQVTEELQSVGAEKDQLLSEKTSAVQTSAEEMENLLSKVASLTEERDQLKMDLQANVERLTELTEELQSVRAEKDALLSEKTSAVQTSPEEMENLLSKVASLTEERDQLKMDLQENVEMMIENQEELRTALEKNREQKERLKQLETAQMSTQDSLTNEKHALQLEELQNQIKALTEELQSVRAERDSLLSERAANPQTSGGETEQLLSKVTSLSEERDQLQEILEGLKEEKRQLKADLEERMEMMQSDLQQQLDSGQQNLKEEQDAQKLLQIQQLEEQLERTKEEMSQLRIDLKENVEMMIENQEELRVAQEKIRVLEDEINRLQTEKAELESRQGNGSGAEIPFQLEELQNQIQQLTAEIESVRAERDTLLSERAANLHTSGDETEQLLSKVTSLSEERDQLQEILEGLREEKRQLKADLEERMETLQVQLEQLHASLQTVTEQKSQLESDLQQNTEMAATSQILLHSIQEELREQKQKNSDLEKLGQEKECSFDQQSLQIQQLTAEIESVRAERDTLLSERAANLQTSGDETEQLLSKVTSLSEERDQLQEILEGLREEKRQLKADLEERMETLQVQLEQLHTSLQTVTEQKSQLESDLQQNTEMAATSQILLQSVQEELQEQKQKNSDLEKLGQEKECCFDQQMRTLTEKLESIQAERDGLLSEKAASLHDTEEMKRLLLQMEEELKQEKIQRKADMEEKMEKISVIQEKLKEQEDLSMQAEEVAQLQHEIQQLKTEQTNITEENSQLQRELQDKTEMINQAQVLLKQQQHLNAHLQEEKEQQEAQLRKQVQQLQEELHILKERQSHAKAEAEASHQLLSEANTTISVLKGQISSLDQSSNGTSEAKEGGLSARLQDSTLQLQERFSRFQLFKNSCSEFRVGIAPLDHALRVQDSLMHPHLTTLPNPTIKTYSAVRKLWMQTIRTLGNITKLPLMACDYKRSFQELVKKDLAVFEERRLQDVLLCRVQAPSYSVKEEDLQTLWEHRLSELLDKREFYLQKMDSLLEKLEATMTTYSGDLSEGLREKERFSEQLQALLTMQPLNLSTLDSVLSCELSHCSAVAHSKKMILQGMLDEHIAQSKELEQLEMQADVQLREERSKTSTLLQMLESAPLKTEADLLSDNQQLALQLQQSEKEVKAMNVKIVQLEEAQVKAKDLVSNHKQATQLLQTELQDARAQVSEKGNTIQSLKKKLQEAEDYAKKNASPSAIELEKLRDQVVKMKVELTSASSKHQEEIKKMNTLLNIKEESLRKLKETLRKSQQDGEESILQGKDLYDRLTNSKGLIVQSSILLEKTKLEEEVKLLQVKIAELESLVSSQQAEIAKWKSRAIKLKEKSKVVVDKPLSPCTPTKRRLPMTSDCSNFITSPKRFLGTPKKTLDSPKMVDSPKKLLSCPDSPKTRFFDGTESLTRNCPKQFFDNSNLGTLPEISCAPSVADEASLGAEEDVATGAEKREEWWPLSPKQADLCKNQ
ncbi:centromere-associated protein E isoform X2 [Myripristis murdjan]|uniref:centromere-associated protein E isoform X2 n=1 Tax=Myripristis murdjan TaxID=586833 RepID=UPI0011763886|nr:centromere-associated protein E isoform X2 [Myripristis murdjan]